MLILMSELRLWTPKLGVDGGFEHRTKWNMALNAEIGDANRSVKLKSDDDGSER